MGNLTTINTDTAPTSIVSHSLGQEGSIWSRGGGEVYAALFSDGWVKVGRGRCGASRIKKHAGLSAMRGAHLIESVVSGPISGYKDAERRLINFCVATGSRAHGSEWFTGIDFGRLTTIIKDEFQKAPLQNLAEARARSDAAADRMLKSIDAHLKQPADMGAEVEQKKWNSSLVHAACITRLFLEDGYGGSLFAIAQWGLTKFETLCAVAVHGMTCYEIAEVYRGAISNPNETLEIITSAGDAKVREYIKQRNG